MGPNVSCETIRKRESSVANYLVRLIENKEIVGFFNAVNDYELFWLVDECTDPWACERKKLVGGWGIMWPAPKAFKVPLKNLEAEVKLNKAQLTEGATTLLLDEGKWKPVAVEERKDYYYRG